MVFFHLWFVVVFLPPTRINVVLDDNKKLCLSSGEIIKLKDTQTMMFEVADLAVASPATVSRCGMVYLEPGVLGLHPYINCWLRRLPSLVVPYTEELRSLCEIYLLPSLDLLRSRMKEIVGSVDSALVQSFLALMDYRLVPVSGKDNKPPPASQFLRLIPGLLVPWTVFSLTWSIGSTCDYESRVNFSNWLRATMEENKHNPLGLHQKINTVLHDGGFTDITEDNEPLPPTWHSWMENVEEYVINPDMKYSDIEVPTIDNIRNAEMIGILLNNENNVLCIGPTGTGKTLTVTAKLSRNMHKKFICDFITFSARTSANQTQDLIDSKLDRRRKGVFGPPILKKQVFFIDDFNMPALEVYGAQPPIELIRQWMDFKGWYDRKNVGEFRNIIDVNFVAAMGPPGGGRNPVTARCLRHFHFITFTEMEDSSKITIFGSILQSWISRMPDLTKYYENITNATLSVYKTILQELLPTPAKTHYTFNLRDLSKVFQGILMLEPETVDNIELLLRLWYHENCRVYQDRLVNDDDRNWFDKLLREKVRQDFKADDATCIGDGNVLFGDFLDPTADIKIYREITDMDNLSKVLN
ncbi:Dynein heavy chain at 36C [Carabus blaptoides fortunei]